jgi:general stress protein 26
METADLSHHISRRFNEDLERLGRKLQRRGWPQARVKGTYELDDTSGLANVTLEIDSGPIVRIAFVGNKAIDDDDQLWFFMSRSSETVAEFQGDDQVNVSYADPGSDTYVSVSGIANVVENPLKKKSLWNKEAEAWFKGGPEDPDLALVCVQIEHADYWNVKDNKLVQLYKRAEAALTGKPSRPGEHGRFQPH